MTTAQLILDDPKFSKAEMCYVSVYESNSVYGGPEEGGWWHRYNTYLGSVKFFNREHAEAYLEQAEQQAEQLRSTANARFREYYESRYSDDSIDIEDDFCRGETASADEYWVAIEETPGESDNSKEPIPHWE